MRLRNRLYDRGLLKTWPAPVQAICVGNLSTGGTGKTPVVATLAAAATRAGRRPAILTRGYRPRGVEGPSDEVLLFHRLVPDVPVIVDPDRRRGAARAVGSGADLLLLDDGFQHRRFARHVDLVLLDARDPFAGGLLPAGRLREPFSALSRATAVVLTRCGRATPEQISRAEEAVRTHAPTAPILHEDHVVRATLPKDGGPARRLHEAQVLVFSGIADAGALAETVVALGARLVRAIDFGDHHPFAPAEIRALEAESAAMGVDLVVTTEKDLVRLTGESEWRGHVPLVAPRVVPRFRPQDLQVLAALVGFEIGDPEGE